MRFLLSIFIGIVALAVYHRDLITQQLNTFVPSHITTTISSMSETTANTQQQQTSSFPGLPVVPPEDPSLTQTPNMSIPRAIRKAFLAVEQAEGVGARVRRSIGTPKLRNFSPFLMLDHFSIKPGAGFPDHPHRGQETITYLLKGAVDHEDFAGHKGTIRTGDLQFMTAGRYVSLLHVLELNFH